MNKQFVIPAPLAAGAPIRMSDDRTIRYFNPVWEGKINDSRNVEYFEAVHDSLMTDESHMDDNKVRISPYPSTNSSEWTIGRIVARLLFDDQEG